MRNPRVRGVVLALGLASGLGAAEPDANAVVDPPLFPATYGFQVYLARPLLNLRSMTNRTGIGGGLYMEEPLGPNTFLQSRIDYVDYKQVNNLASTNGLDFIPANVTALSANSATIGLDLRQYLPYSGMKRIYIIAGTSATRYEFQTLAPGTAVDQNGIPVPNVILNTKTKTSLKWGVDIGLGYDLSSRWAVIARYTFLPVDGQSLAALEYGLRVRF